MGGKKAKLERKISWGDAGAALREIAAGIDRGRLALQGAVVPRAQVKSLKVGLKRGGEGLVLKVKVEQIKPPKARRTVRPAKPAAKPVAAKKPAKQPAKKSAKKGAKKPAKKGAKTPAKKPAKRPAKRPAKKPAKKPAGNTARK